MADPFSWATESPFDEITPGNMNSTLDSRAWNLAVNPLMEAFDTGDHPSWWGYTGTVEKETTTMMTGGASAKITTGGSIRQDYYGVLTEAWRSQTITVSVVLRQDAADAATMTFDFGSATLAATTKSAPVDSFFRWDETFTVDASATKLELQLGANGDTVYIDRVAVWEGGSQGTLGATDGAALLLCEGRGDNATYEADKVPRIASGMGVTFDSLTGLTTKTETDAFSITTPDFWPTGTSNPVGAGTGDEVLAFMSWDTAGADNNANKAFGLVNGGVQTNGKMPLTANCASGATFSADDLTASGLVFLYAYGPEPPVSRAWTNQ